MLRILVSTLLVSLFLVTASVAGDDDQVLGKAGDYTIMKSDLDRLISYYPPDKQKHLRENPQQKITLVKRMLEVRTIADLARKDGFDKRPDVREQLEFMINDYLSREYLSKVVAKDVSISEEDIEQYYSVNKKKFSTPEQVRVRYILVRIPSRATTEAREKAKMKAAGILEKAKEGEDFAKLAEEFSDDTRSKAKGGDLGYVSRDKMEEHLGDAAFSLRPGQTSEVIETKFGYFFIKVEDRKEATTKPLAEVRDSIRQELNNSFAKSKTEDFVNKAEIDSGMAVYPDKVIGLTPSK